jgi:DNA-binding NtrC family response regulator
VKQTVLFLSDEEPRLPWTSALLQNGFELKRCTTGQEASECGPAAVVLAWRDRIEGLPELMVKARAPLILIQPNPCSDLAASARAAGVSDYLREPVSPEELINSIQSCIANSKAQTSRGLLAGGERLVGHSRVIKDVRRTLAGIAATECNTLITGETGTGKELAAELIHRNSRRKANKFVCVNCAAIPETLLESELFGYEKGAFTSAHNSSPGQWELAAGGTLFLDEIGEMSLAAQAKILRAIDRKEVQRLGRSKGIRADVRIVCATNRDLETEVARGSFRSDLFFRLNVTRLRLAPLRERKEDIPELVSHFLEQMNARMGSHVSGFSEHSWHSLLKYHWPGNVRELRNLVENSLVHLPYAGMRLMELPEEFHRQVTPKPVVLTEADELLLALVSHNWNKSKAAQHLRWSRMRLYRKMAQYHLSSPGKATTKVA